jgi:hypothetical protein
MTAKRTVLTFVASVAIGVGGVLLAGYGCEAAINRQNEAVCPESGAAAGLPFKIAKINAWSECYLKCPNSWVPADGFKGCRQ